MWKWSKLHYGALLTKFTLNFLVYFYNNFVLHGLSLTNDSSTQKVDDEDDEERPPPHAVEQDSDKLANVIAEKLTPEMAT